jgi:hypothetical protein
MVLFCGGALAGKAMLELLKVLTGCCGAAGASSEHQDFRRSRSVTLFG